MTPHPTEIKLKKAEKKLEIKFDDGERFILTAEFLRVESPSAEVQGHGTNQKKIVAGRRHVAIMAIEPVGNYAIRILFDDLHDTGIYSWALLHEMGRNQEKLWKDYLSALRRANLSRDP
tara:strand:+ start:1618 stop:1974 length:357 start_codon:yes stop_codon:yes gene_type:complete